MFLNPDTILAEDSSLLHFFFPYNAGCRRAWGAYGRWNRRFLKESKRGFPGVWASFFKMTGLSRLFPRSKIFASYYQGHLDEKTSHAVDILSGAFMMVKKTVLDKTGGFDERFFMYAEDIDLSYRIQQAGYQNYYFADTTIIHFKGESTTRDFRYLKLFYSAMILFMKKHFKGSGSSLRIFLDHGRESTPGDCLLFQAEPQEKKLPLSCGFRTKVSGDAEAQEKWKRWLQKIRSRLHEMVKQKK